MSTKEENEEYKEQFIEYLKSRKYWDDIITLSRKDILLWIVTYECIVGENISYITLTKNYNSSDFIVKDGRIYRILKQYNLTYNSDYNANRFIKFLSYITKINKFNLDSKGRLMCFEACESSSCANIYVIELEEELTDIANEMKAKMKKIKEEPVEE